jgi:hypothetical protein
VFFNFSKSRGYGLAAYCIAVSLWPRVSFRLSWLIALGGIDFVTCTIDWTRYGVFQFLNENHQPVSNDIVEPVFYVRHVQGDSKPVPGQCIRSVDVVQDGCLHRV